MFTQAKNRCFLLTQAHCVVGLDYKKHIMVSTLGTTGLGIC
jgi:hypothetical protein